MDRDVWIAACAHHLQRQWRTVDPDQLEELAGDVWADERLRAMMFDAAVTHWLRPVASEDGNPGRHRVVD